MNVETEKTLSENNLRWCMVGQDEEIKKMILFEDRKGKEKKTMISIGKTHIV